MKVSTGVPSHLSNYEVLQHLISQKAEHDKLQKLIKTNNDRTAQAAREKFPLPDEDDDKEFPTVPRASVQRLKAEDTAFRRGFEEQVAFVQDEVIKYLCLAHSSTPRQTPHGITTLIKELHERDLAKGEVLQIVNLCPKEAVELYPIIEQLDERFGDDATAILKELAGLVADSLIPSIPDELVKYCQKAEGEVEEQEMETAGYVDEGEFDAEEDQFVHEAEWGNEKEEGIGEEKENDME